MSEVDAPEDLDAQLARLRGPRPTIRVERPCTPGDGIGALLDAAELEGRAREVARTGRLTKFLPAAGAATRLLGPVRAWKGGSTEGLEHAAKLALWPEGATDPVQAATQILRTTVGLPKGLVPFHHGVGTPRTATEEHLREARALGARVHLVVSPKHGKAFKAHVAELSERVTDLPEVDFSAQAKATRTVALSADEQPVRHTDGALLLRPAGHGALLANLAALQADLVLIENIDNVSCASWQERVVPWRRRLVGALSALQERVHDVLEVLDRDGAVPAEAAPVLAELGWRLDDPQVDAVRACLDRPLRVCGMVANSGQPGGGPFWVRDAAGQVRRQIVESVHLDATDPDQQAAVQASTHFNPVEVACAVRDRHGQPYDLATFTDDGTWIVTDKTHRGQLIRALERPGLWNGAMAGWNTVFVELPAEVFTPVKTVLDLMHPAHGVR